MTNQPDAIESASDFRLRMEQYIMDDADGPYFTAAIDYMLNQRDAAIEARGYTRGCADERARVIEECAQELDARCEWLSAEAVRALATERDET